MFFCYVEFQHTNRTNDLLDALDSTNSLTENVDDLERALYEDGLDQFSFVTVLEFAHNYFNDGVYFSAGVAAELFDPVDVVEDWEGDEWPARVVDEDLYFPPWTPQGVAEMQAIMTQYAFDNFAVPAEYAEFRAVLVACRDAVVAHYDAAAAAARQDLH